MTSNMVSSLRISPIIIILHTLLWALFACNVQAEDEAKAVVIRLIQMMETNCEQQYKDEHIQKTISYTPKAQQKILKINIEIRKYAECHCVPSKLKSISNETLRMMEENNLKMILKPKLKSISLDCVATSFRKHWIPFCQEFMVSETELSPQKSDQKQ